MSHISTRNKTRKKLSVNLLAAGMVMLIAYAILTFVLKHNAIGLVGGGLGWVAVFFLLMQHTKRIRKNGSAD